MDKKELLEKFFKYVVITMILGIVICSIAYLYNAQKMDISFIKDVYSILFSIFAPLFAIYLFADWKDQKQYELEKDIFDKILDNIALSYYEINQINSRINLIGSKIEENIVIFKNRDKYNIKYNIERFTLIYSQLDRYKVISNNDDLLILFREYENYYLLLKVLNTKLLKIYEEYFNKIDDTLVKEKVEDISHDPYHNNQEFDSKKNQFRNVLNKVYKTRFKGDRTGVKEIVTEMNYNQANEKIKELYNQIVEIIVLKSKPDK